VSLRREDAERLGYNNQRAWRDLAVSRIAALGRAMKIPAAKLRWYAAFHNEGTHPHMHMAVFSADARSGYLSKAGIEQIKSGFAHEIFKQDFYQIYEQKQSFSDGLTRYGREYMQTLIDGISADSGGHPELERLLTDLSAGLRDHKGKKVYGFLKPGLKAKADAVVRALAADPRIAELYRGWCECRNEILRTYKFDIDAPPPLEKQPEFRSIHNAVIKAAAELNISPAADPERDGGFLLPESKPESEGIVFADAKPLEVAAQLHRPSGKDENHAPQEQEHAGEAVIQQIPEPQTPLQAQAGPQTETPAAHPARQAGPPALTNAALAAARLLRSLGDTVYGSYQNGQHRLFAQADRRQLRKQALKKTAHGQRLEKHAQTRY
jgi:hypothetical protein